MALVSTRPPAAGRCRARGGGGSGERRQIGFRVPAPLRAGQ